MIDSKPRMGNRSFWLNLDLATEFCKLVRSQKLATVTEEMNMIIEKRLSELKGGGSVDPDEPSDKVYERLFSKHSGLSRQELALEKLLEDSGSCGRFLKVLGADSLEELKMGLTGGVEGQRFRGTLRLVLEAGRKSGDSMGATNFVGLLKLVREMKTLEAQLEGLVLREEKATEAIPCAPPEAS